MNDQVNKSLLEQNSDLEFCLSEDEVSFLEIDMVNLGLIFDFVETIDYEEDIGGLEFSKVMNSPIDLLLLNSVDIGLLKANISNLMEDYNVEVELEPIKKIGKRVKEYLFKVVVYKDQQLWEEYTND